MSFKKTWLLFEISFLVLAALIGLVVWKPALVGTFLPYELPKERLRFEELKPPSTREILDCEGIPLSYLADDHVSFYRPLHRIDPKIADLVIFLEDAKFYYHKGFDTEEIENSLRANLKHGSVKRGGSTLTQQLAKNLFLDREKTYLRKFFEIPWTLRLEKDFSKKQILELYLNSIEWGPGLIGVEAASRHFFDKSAASVTLGEAMYLALIIPNPVRFDLFRNPDRSAFMQEKKQRLIERLYDDKKTLVGNVENYSTAQWKLSSLLNEERRYPLFHDGGRYRGEAHSTSDTLGLILKNVSKTNQHLSLSKKLQNLVDSWGLIESDVAEKRYFILKENADDELSMSAIRAIRLIPANFEIAQDDLNSFNSDAYTTEERPYLEWKNLALSKAGNCILR